jgi:hypothetical protein
MRGCVEPGDVQKGEEMERFNKKQGAELVGVRLPPTRIQKTPKRWVPYTERGWRGGGGGRDWRLFPIYIYYLYGFFMAAEYSSSSDSDIILILQVGDFLICSNSRCRT